jgi:hypothetical protein
MTGDGRYSYAWNGEGFLKPAGTTTYTYDGDGKRVMNSAGTYFWTDPSGEQVSDTPGSGLPRLLGYSGALQPQSRQA